MFYHSQDFSNTCFVISAKNSASVRRDNKDDDKFEETYDLKLLYRIINKLPDDTKQPFMMFVSGLKYKEIAEKMDLPIGTIKSRLHFARKKLQKDLRDFS